MWRHPILLFFVSIYVAWGSWHWFTNRPIHVSDGVLVAAEPQQTLIPDGEKILHGRWTLTVRATYRITARVLGRETYNFDALSDLIPQDIALGWGPMSDSRVLRSIDMSQENRFFNWRTSAKTLVAIPVIITHAANTHVIPANASIARQLLHLRPGEVVTLSGELVDATRTDGRWIKTSLVRDDTGAGACEVMWVTDVDISS
jgi:hypothetical protein